MGPPSKTRNRANRSRGARRQTSSPRSNGGANLNFKLYATEFGMTPATRSRISLGVGYERSGKFGDLQRKRAGCGPARSRLNECAPVLPQGRRPCFPTWPSNHLPMQKSASGSACPFTRRAPSSSGYGSPACSTTIARSSLRSISRKSSTGRSLSRLPRMAWPRFPTRPEFVVTKEASLHMDDAPQNLGSVPVTKTMWQTDMIAIRLKFQLSWILRDPRAVAWVQGCTW